MLETQWGDRRLRSSYLGYISANRKLFAQYEQQNYRSIPSIPKQTPPVGKSLTPSKPKIIAPVRINPECARLNLWPLLQEDNAIFYGVALQLLEECYGPSLFVEDPKGVALFFKAFMKQLKNAHSQGAVHLEKLDLGPLFHKTYYAMLKGTKEWDPCSKTGYPSLLDLVKVEEASSKLCLIHAHLGVCIALFGPKVGPFLYEKVHQDPSAVRSLEWMEQIYADLHQLMGNPLILEFVELNNTIHKKNQRMTLVADDQDLHISLRKTLMVRSKQL